MLKKSSTNVYIVDFKEYIKIGNWKNKKDQHQLIVNYKKNLKFQKYQKNKFKIIIINFLIDIELYFRLRMNKHNFSS